MSSSSVEKITGLSSFQVRVYFKWDSLKKAATWTLIVGLVIAALGFYISEASVILIGSALILLGIAIFYFFGKKLPSDAQIDEAWEKLAASRENEGYRVGNFKRSDAIRDSEHFFAWPQQFGDTEYRERYSSNDGLVRRNYLDVVRLIYGEDQIISFRETVCLEDGWDGLDEIKEYYWSDVAGIEFDQKSATFEIVASGKVVEYPLGRMEGGNLVENLANLRIYTQKCETIANAIRSVLRSKKKK